MAKIEALLDANVFIYAFEVPKSNSRIVINALNNGLFEAVTTESTFRKVNRYFKRYHSISLAEAFRLYIFVSCKAIISSSEKINKKGLGLGVKYSVSYGKSFEGVTPKQFVEILNLKAFPTDY